MFCLNGLLYFCVGLINVDFAINTIQGFFYHSFYDIPLKSPVTASKWRDGYALNVKLADGFVEFFKTFCDVFVFRRVSPVEFCGEVDDNLFFSIAVQFAGDEQFARSQFS